MLFNIDRNTKQNILNQYKQDALDYENRKAEEKKRKIEEERAYIAQSLQQDAQYQNKMEMERARRKNEIMGEYQRMLQQNQGRPAHRSRIEDVKINNYGYDPSRSDPTQYLQQVQMNANAGSNQMQNKSSEYDRATSPSQREKLLIRREDHMGNYLTDKVNENELKNYFKNQKVNQQILYKQMLDDQVK